MESSNGFFPLFDLLTGPLYELSHLNDPFSTIMKIIHYLNSILIFGSIDDDFVDFLQQFPYSLGHLDGIRNVHNINAYL